MSHAGAPPGCVHSIETALGPRCAAIEHFGSTAVPGLLAKPIVDILVASVDGAAPSPRELEALAELRGAP